MEYLLGEVIHLGPYTRVIGAKDPRTGELLAIKVPHESAGERVFDRIRHEYTMLRDVQGPGVVRVVALAPWGMGHALVMERWGQSSLGKLLQQGPLSIGSALLLGIALARALGQVHQKGLIHRDIKPHNVLVDAEKRDVRLIDFGIAVRRSVYVAESAAAGSPAGTMAYIAPEQIGRMNSGADSRADLYSLGATLYQMFTGALPFEASELSALIHAHIVQTPIAPHERAPALRIPPMVSAIVLKLMAKNPEDRYQTAEGVAFDLERAGQQWLKSGTVLPFPLGEKDFEDRIRKPSRLFGREVETAALNGALERICAGAVELWLVAGPSGVGKSVLVQSLRDSVRSRHGILATGKFDLLQRGTPYLALSQALRSVVRRRLADSGEQLLHWQAAWSDAAGPNGRILVDLIPELVHILGEPKPLIEVGPMEAKNRFVRTVQRFVQVLAKPEHPLVLFLDDLQWADPASLLMLEELLTDPDTKHMLVVGAYRSDEVSSIHPLSERLSAMQQKGLAPKTLLLAPLGLQALSALIANMLGRPSAEVEGLAELVKAKTDGSPFFVERFLKALHEHKLLQRDPQFGRWLWQREAIERAGITDNVVALLTHRLRALSPALQSVLQTAACIGNRFERSLLEGLVEKSADEVTRALAEAVQEGLLLYEEEATQAACAFVHDRVQQAAYELLPAKERLVVHLRIGRQLRECYGTECADDALFSTLYHRNRAMALIPTEAEKRDLAAQNLRAGQRAFTSAAYTEATEFFRIGRELFGETLFAENYALGFELNLGLAAALTLAGQADEGERLFQQTIAYARDDFDKARVSGVWLPLLTATGKYAQGVELGFLALDWLKSPFPRVSEEQEALFTQNLRLVESLIAQMEPGSWSGIACSVDRTHHLKCLILMRFGTCAAFVQPILCPLSYSVIAIESLRRGMTPYSLEGLATTALQILLLSDKSDLARALLEATLAMTDQHQTMLQGTALNSIANASHYYKPLAQVTELYARMSRRAAHEGNIVFIGFGKIFPLYTEMLRGAHLASLEEANRAEELKNLTFAEMQRNLALTITALRRLPPLDKAEAKSAEDELAEICVRARISPVHEFYGAAMAAWAGLHLGADAWAAKAAMAIEPLWIASWGVGPLVAFTFTYCLTVQRCLSGAPAAERARLEERLAFHHGHLAAWSESAPETFRHMLLLVNAERARQDGRHEEAERLYEQAIEDAHRNALLHAEALGLRLAGDHLRLQGKVARARAYLGTAAGIYSQWGAMTAAARIRTHHPDLFPLSPEPLAAPEASASSPLATSADAVTTTRGGLATTTTGPMNARLDAASMLRAAQALSSDMILDSLLGRMLRLLAENAGAERAVLGLHQDGTLRIEAELVVQPERLSLGLHEPISASPRLPATLVQYVERSKEPVILGQASTDSRFDEDPYLRKHHPASVLAVPLAHQGRLSGILYLEHARVPEAFPKERVELVSLLASQAATAVENARLYAQVQAASQALQRVNLSLEAEVAARTAELQMAMAELWSEMDLAKKIQTVLLPREPRIQDYELATVMRPAEQVGGDYYDVFRQGAKDWVLIGDVSGHGISAGLCMMMIQTAIRSTALTLEKSERPLTPRLILSLVNQAVQSNLQQIGRNQYMTITALCIEGGTVRYAGLHLELLVYRAASQQVERIETRGAWLGVMDDVSDLLEEDELKLEAGDMLLLYTDGYTDAVVVGRRLEAGGLAESFGTLARRALPCQELLTELLQSLAHAAVRDDVTLVVLRRLSTPSLSLE